MQRTFKHALHKDVVPGCSIGDSAWELVVDFRRNSYTVRPVAHPRGICLDNTARAWYKAAVAAAARTCRCRRHLASEISRGNCRAARVSRDLLECPANGAERTVSPHNNLSLLVAADAMRRTTCTTNTGRRQAMTTRHRGTLIRS